MKKIIFIIFITVITGFLTGCWSYVGLDEMTIVTGVAIDKGENNEYSLTFEVIDLANSNKETGIETKILTSNGKTIFDAIRNAKAKIANKLYFSNAQIIIIGNEIATSEGILEVINFFARDAEIRETAMVLISKEETAASLFETEGITSNIIAFKMLDIISNAEKINLYSSGVQLFQVINMLNSEGVSLMLPTFHIVEENIKSVELNGLAAFDKDKLTGYLLPEETKYILFVIDKVDGGIFTFSSNNKEEEDISLEIHDSKTNVNYKYENNQLKFYINVKVRGFLGEYKNQKEVLNEQRVKELEKKAAASLKIKILENIKKVQQNEFGDVFGFGSKIYRKDPELWNNLKKDWKETFKTLDIEVNCEINLINTALLR